MMRMAAAGLFLALLATAQFACDSSESNTEQQSKEDVIAGDDTDECTPSCDGKTCGDDGCGGTCGNCFTLEGAIDNNLCVEGQCVDCLPDCDGKACGDDGCGGTCGNCFTLEGAIDDSLCIEGECVQCVPDCEGRECGDNGCGGVCGECSGDEVCAGGICGVDDGLCDVGQLCLEISEDGFLGCQDGDGVPAANMTQCHEVEGGCPGNFSCLYLDDEGTQSICLENCGECGAGTTCSDVTGDGYLGCLTAGSIPSNALYGCHEMEGGCPGNATCFYLNAEYTESVCIDNCSSCHPGSCGEGMVCNGVFCEPEPCTEGSCPDGQNCISGTCVPDAGPGPGPYTGGLEACDLPPLVCEGTNEYCGELIQFDPTEGVGYIDYPENGETWDNQYRSWLQRQGVMAIQYAAAKVACLAADWEFGNGQPIGLIDMSEEDGSIPGTSVGSPGHPQGTHTNGADIDVSYYQHGTADNSARPICDHYENGAEAYHCTAPPHLLDPWRQALFIGALFEHPELRVIGCDGQAGPIIVAAMDELCEQGWLTEGACKTNALTFETTDQGMGWFYFHHHHIHISFFSARGQESDACLVPGCLDQHLRHFLSRFGLATPAQPQLPLRLVPVARVR